MTKNNSVKDRAPTADLGNKFEGPRPHPPHDARTSHITSGDAKKNPQYKVVEK